MPQHSVNRAGQAHHQGECGRSRQVANHLGHAQTGLGERAGPLAHALFGRARAQHHKEHQVEHRLLRQVGEPHGRRAFRHNARHGSASEHRDADGRHNRPQASENRP